MNFELSIIHFHSKFIYLVFDPTQKKKKMHNLVLSAPVTWEPKTWELQYSKGKRQASSMPGVKGSEVPSFCRRMNFVSLPRGFFWVLGNMNFEKWLPWHRSCTAEPAWVHRGAAWQHNGFTVPMTTRDDSSPSHFSSRFKTCTCLPVKGRGKTKEASSRGQLFSKNWDGKLFAK